MDIDLIDLFERGSKWTKSKVAGAKDRLDDPTPCERWKVRDVMNHLLDTQRYFRESAAGKDAALPNGETPPDKLAKDPVRQYERARKSTLDAYRGEGVLEKTGPALGIAFVDQLVHGWDIAKATGQDTTMPDDLARAAFQMLDGRLTDEQRGDGFKPAVQVAEGAPAQEKLLAYVGREPN
jgi:uncharacterized protein (TIGR03086 family)